MKLRTLIMVAIGMLSTHYAIAAESTSVNHSTSNAVLKTEKDKVSYSIGFDLGQNFKIQSLDIDAAMLAKGMQDGLSGITPVLTKQQMTDVLMAFQKKYLLKNKLNLISSVLTIKKQVMII